METERSDLHSIIHSPKNHFMQKEDPIGTGNTDRDDTIAMVAHYKIKHRKAMEVADLKVADWGWMDLDRLLDYLLALKYRRKADGVRIYFAAHDKKLVPDPKLPYDYKDYNTTVLVGTTYNAEKKKHEDLPAKDKHGIEAGTDYAFTIGESQLHFLGSDEDRSHLHPPHPDTSGDESVEAQAERMAGRSPQPQNQQQS